MKTSLKLVALSTLCATALGLSQHAAATPIATKVQFDRTGTGNYSVTGITSLDWDDNESMVLEQIYVSATGAAGAACAATPTLTCFFQNSFAIWHTRNQLVRAGPVGVFRRERILTEDRLAYLRIQPEFEAFRKEIFDES